MYIGQDDRELIKDFIVVIMISGSFVLGAFLIMTFIFFYGDPSMIAIVAIALILKIRVNEEGTEISFERFINKYIKISLTITK